MTQTPASKGNVPLNRALPLETEFVSTAMFVFIFVY